MVEETFTTHLSLIENQDFAGNDSGREDSVSEYSGLGGSMPFGFGRQTTLRQKVHVSGVGLHCGRTVNLTLEPAAPNTGIRFVRTDVAEHGTIFARWDQVVDTTLCTQIGNEAGVRVGTVEHLMAALAAAGVDNVTITLDAPEPPAMDGSSEPFLFLLECAGLRAQSAPRQVLRVLRPVRVSDGEKSASLLPADRAEMDVAIDFAASVIGRQSITMTLTGARFKRELSRARTFGFLHEVEYMKSKGLALGGSLDNAVVIEGETVLNPDGLRYRNEFVRHKALDVVGDLYLAGGPILGRFVGEQSGHALNNRLLHALMADVRNFEWIDRAPVEKQAALA